MVCKDCVIFHDGVLKGECRCSWCICRELWLRELNKPKKIN